MVAHSHSLRRNAPLGTARHALCLDSARALAALLVRTGLVALALCACSARAARAGWPVSGHVLYSGSFEDRGVVATGDGAGGLLVSLYSDPGREIKTGLVPGGPYKLVALNVSESGSDAYGVTVAPSSYPQTAVAIARASSGGAILVWSEARETAVIGAQRLNAVGGGQWGAGGVLVAASSGAQSAPAVVPDASDGVIVVWVDARSGSANLDVYAQRLDGSGQALWGAGGVPVCAAPGNQGSPVLLAAAGGAIVLWQDERNGNQDIYAQRLDAAGNSMWSADGVALCTAAGDQTGVAAAPDAGLGAVAAWTDARAGSASSDIYAQRVDAAGTVQWQADGIPVCGASEAQFGPSIAALGTDGSCVIAWEDRRTDAGNSDLYAQRITLSGAAQWPADGAAVCTGTGNQYAPTVAADGTGGALIAWREGCTSCGSAEAYAQRVSPTGALAWGPGAAALSNVAPSTSLGRDRVAITSDGAGEASSFGSVVPRAFTRNAC